ncbi:MAG: amidohydrolase [Dehalococcoidia bacterium]
MVTVDDDFSTAEAVAIGGGRFLKVGGNAEVRALAGPDTEQRDLGGKTVVPGFVDSHPHVISHGIARVAAVPLMGLRSIEDIKKRISEKVEKTPPGEWVVAAPVGDPPDYFHLPETLREGRWPTCRDLDEVSPHNPVYVASPLLWAPHPAILNSRGLKLLGVTRDTPSEENGTEIVKDAETGEPNGQLHRMHRWNYGSLYWKLMAQLPSPTFEQMMDGFRAELKVFNAAGVTTGYECHATTPGQLLLCRELWSRDELTVRVCFAYEVDVKKSLAQIESWMKDLAHATGSGFGDDRLKIGGVTVSLDGPSQLGVSVMNKPYLDPYGKSTSGVQEVPTEKFKGIALLAARNNLRMNVQVGGDKATDIALEAYEEVNRQFPLKDRRWVLQHIQHPSQGNIDKCRELGIVITTCSNFEFSKGTETYVKRLGGDYCDRAIPLRRWLDAGVLAAQSTDGAHYEPMFSLWQSLKRVDGRTGKSLMTPDKEITREEALRMYTINGARVLFWEDKLGSIEAGKLADLVVLDHDILTCPLDEIRDTGVLMTMVGGEAVYEGSRRS